MIASGPGGSLPSARPVAEAQGQTNAARAAPPPVSGAPGEVGPALGVVTLRAVDPANQGATTAALPREETAERASLRRGLVEPARYAPTMLAGEAPTEATPAGPPPTFDLSILEKTRAVDRAAPPVARPAPEQGEKAEPVRAPREAEGSGPKTVENDPATAREPAGARTEAAKDRPERPEPALREAAPPVTGDVAAPVPARRDPVPSRG